jgi:hypothetical protein
MGTVICPDPWKDGARNTTESGGRKINENKLLTRNTHKVNPYAKTGTGNCKDCGNKLKTQGMYLYNAIVILLTRQILSVLFL